MRHKHTEQAKIDQKYDNFTKELQTFVSAAQTKIGNAIRQSRKYDFPNCDELENDIQESMDDINNTIQRYGNSLASEKSNKGIQITSVEQLLNYWDSNGKILSQISIPELLETIKEGEIRFRYKMPPGYMDENEKDKELQKKPQLDNFYGRVRKYGDLFVWKEIIKVGIANSDKKIVFITNDVKEDWWDTKQGNVMRSELYNEFVTITNNESSFACGTPFWKALRVFKKEPMEERYRQFLLKIEKCGEVRYYLETTEQPNEILEMLSLLYQKKILFIRSVKEVTVEA